MRIGTILVLVGNLLVVTLYLWRDVGAGVALLVAAGLSLLVATAWRYVPLTDWRRFQIAFFFGIAVSFVVSWI